MLTSAYAPLFSPPKMPVPNLLMVVDVLIGYRMSPLFIAIDNVLIVLLWQYCYKRIIFLYGVNKLLMGGRKRAVNYVKSPYIFKTHYRGSGAAHAKSQ
jgi:hypothetical protein